MVERIDNETSLRGLEFYKQRKEKIWLKTDESLLRFGVHMILIAEYFFMTTWFSWTKKLNTLCI